MNDKELELLEIWEEIWNNMRLIVVITVAVTLAAGLVSFFILKPKYEASVSIIVGRTGANEAGKTFDNNDVIMYQNLVKTYVEIAKSDVVSEKASKILENKLTSEKIQQSITVTPQANTQILTIKSQADTGELSMKTANAVTEAFIEACKVNFPTGDVKILDVAKLPDKAVSPKKMLNIVVGFFLGLMVSIGIIFLKNYLNTTVNSEADIKKYLDIPVLGVIPDIRELENKNKKEKFYGKYFRFKFNHNKKS